MKLFATNPIIIFSFMLIPALVIAKSNVRDVPYVYSCGEKKEFAGQLALPEDPMTTKAFIHLMSLVGDREGTYQWSGASKDHGKMDAKYYLAVMDLLSWKTY